MLVTVYSQQYKLDAVRWGPRKHFLLFKYKEHSLLFDLIKAFEVNFSELPSQYYEIPGAGVVSRNDGAEGIDGALAPTLLHPVLLARHDVVQKVLNK